jgi:Domain of Unknown Function (DUF1206)
MTIDPPRVVTAFAAAPVSPTIEWLARIGYASRGLVYILAGLFSLSAAIEGGRSAGPKGALANVIQVPFGDILLYCIALGLICFGVWRTTQAIYDPDKFSRGPSSALRRLIVYGGSAFVHFGLAVAAINVAFVSRSADEDREARDWTAWLLSQPFGRALTMVVGLGIVIGGLAFVFQAFKAEFRKNLMVDEDDKEWIVTLGRIGFAARGIVFVMVGCFLIIAGWFHDPRQATGVAGALKALQNSDFGAPLLAATAAGLLCFGLFELGQALWRRIAPAV